ncbi:hypothetical protein [Deinococcus koreensis]|uniref:DUF4333 domain-containing protein n=1 Tax=Deinococcus koreensis TaxID=2054903 RepID=A0A2K3V0X1_9DEIO|nr:hypothetical protein [Deinococcus koreensis]PNY82432.1 hypothetical protein CVO96_14700 [Deinococcus koreensis]
MSKRPKRNPLPPVAPPASPSAPLREVTPEQRRRTARTFWLILLAFVAGIGMLVAALSWQGRAAREYAGDVLEVVQATKPSPNVSYTQKCLEARPGALPSGVLDCDVRVRQGRALVTLQLEGGRQYRLGD